MSSSNTASTEQSWSRLFDWFLRVNGLNFTLHICLLFCTTWLPHMFLLGSATSILFFSYFFFFFLIVFNSKEKKNTNTNHVIFICIPYELLHQIVPFLSKETNRICWNISQKQEYFSVKKKKNGQDWIIQRLFHSFLVSFCQHWPSVGLQFSNTTEL